ncbi:MAG: hypothetical protein KIT72_14720 [Polyangiaceae bacterium]|nr:hypothetical protein [Polyangiaceae bacterium]
MSSHPPSSSQPSSSPASQGPSRITYALLSIALISASLLAYQVLLTRVSALRLHFHFGFLVISNCLLGIGASGSLLAVLEHRWSRDPRRFVWRSIALYLVSLVLTWAFLLTFSVPDTLNFTSVAEALRFSVFNLVAAAPFFVGGATVGLLLSAHSQVVSRVYAADLLGAGLGCVAVPGLLWLVGAGGTFLVVVLLGLFALPIAAPRDRRRVSLGAALVLGVACLALLPKLDRWLPVPGKSYLDLTDRVRANFAKSNEYSRWSANSRIDVLPMPVKWRFMFCRGTAALFMPLPQQKFVLQDGDAGTIVSDFTNDPRGFAVLRRTLYAASVNLLQGTSPEVFVIGMGGGNDVWAAKIHGASRIKAVELNAGVLDVHYKVVPEFSRGITEDPNIEIVNDEGRTALMREQARYDLVQMTGIDTWTSLTSGAYVLAENYLYTVEAFGQMLDRLKPGGILQVTRMAAEMETLRLLNNLSHALGERGDGALEGRVAALSTPDSLTAVLIKPDGFTDAQVKELGRFAQAHGITRVVLPGEPLDNPVAEFVSSPNKQAFVDSFPRDISPTRDDRPYFFNFNRWSKPLESAKFLREPTKVSQGNPAFLLTQLAASTVLAALLIVLPLWVLRRRAAQGGDVDASGAGTSSDRASNVRPRSKAGLLVYFASIGVGFIAIEVALMQKLTLLLGPPLYSIVVTLFALLIFTGVGSALSGRWIERGAPRPWLVPLGVALYVGLWLLLGDRLVATFIGHVTAVRVIVAGLATLPIAVLLGVPFAFGISSMQRESRSLVPWAWAVNGSATVVGSIATVVLSMSLGFNAVMVCAACIYALGFAALLHWRRGVIGGALSPPSAAVSGADLKP